MSNPGSAMVKATEKQEPIPQLHTLLQQSSCSSFIMLCDESECVESLFCLVSRLISMAFSDIDVDLSPLDILL